MRAENFRTFTPPNQQNESPNYFIEQADTTNGTANSKRTSSDPEIRPADNEKLLSKDAQLEEMYETETA